MSSQDSNTTYKRDSLSQELYSTENPSAKVAVLQKLAKLHSADSTDYFRYLNQALLIAQKNNLQKEEYRITYRMGWKYLGYGDILAKKYLLQSLALSSKSNDHEWIGAALNGLGVYNYDSGDLKGSILYYEQALVNYEKAEYVKGFGSIHNNLGISYRRMGDAVKALEHHFLGLAYRQHYNKKEVKESLYNIGNVFLDRKRYFDAEYYFAKALKLEEEGENTLRKARIF